MFNSPNLPYRIATLCIDYALFPLIVANFTFVLTFQFPSPEMGGMASFSLPQHTLLRLFLAYLAFTLPMYVTEFFYILCFPSTIISTFKSQGHPKIPWSRIVYLSIPPLSLIDLYLKTIVTLAVLSWVLFQLNLSSWRLSWANLYSDIFLSIFEGYVIWLLKDAVSLGIFHQIMHWPQFYWLHRSHHRWGKDTSILYTNAAFDLIDLLLENAAGIVLIIPIKYFIFGDPSFNLVSYAIVIWIDKALHSANPYSSAFLNPILDTVFRAVVRHNLHHATVIKHFTFMPWAHIFPSHRQKDIDTYNQILGTKID